MRQEPHGGTWVQALALLVLAAGCASAGGNAWNSRHPAQRESASGIPWATVHTEATSRLPTDFAPVRVEEAEFTAAMAELLLHMPLKVAVVAAPRAPRFRLVRASWAPEAEGLAQDYGQWCARRGPPGDCLALLEDGPHLQDDDKRRLALALAVGPALEGVDSELRAMLDPARLVPLFCLTVAGYMALLVAPEPVTKAVAAAFGLLLWAYLGWELWDLLEGWVQLTEETAQASTFLQVRAASDRFGQRLGPACVRLLVMVGTAALGETAALASRARTLPGFQKAAQAASQHGGLVLEEAVAGVKQLSVWAPEATLEVVVPATAQASVASRAVASRAQPGGTWLPNGHRAFRSFKAFKDAMGSAGPDMNWHHIVEQTSGNVARFGPEAVHNTENVIRLDAELHRKLSGFYSSIQFRITGSRHLTVRKWLATQSYESQRQFGLMALEKVKSGEW